MWFNVLDHMGVWNASFFFSCFEVCEGVCVVPSTSESINEFVRCSMQQPGSMLSIEGQNLQGGQSILDRLRVSDKQREPYHCSLKCYCDITPELGTSCTHRVNGRRTAFDRVERYYHLCHGTCASKCLLR
jgi:hypothetical protein